MYFFACGYPVFLGLFVEKTGLSPLNGFGTLVKNLLTIYVVVVVYSPSGFSVHGIFQAGILEWVAISHSGDLPDPGIEPTSPASPALADGFFYDWVTWEALAMCAGVYF